MLQRIFKKLLDHIKSCPWCESSWYDTLWRLVRGGIGEIYELQLVHCGTDFVFCQIWIILTKIDQYLENENILVCDRESCSKYKNCYVILHLPNQKCWHVKNRIIYIYILMITISIIFALCQWRSNFTKIGWCHDFISKSDSTKGTNWRAWVVFVQKGAVQKLSRIRRGGLKYPFI